MNKRQKKKRDIKLYNAIVELNKMVAEDYEIEFTEDGMLETFNRVKSNHKSIQQTFSDYRKFVKS